MNRVHAEQYPEIQRLFKEEMEQNGAHGRAVRVMGPEDTQIAVYADVKCLYVSMP